VDAALKVNEDQPLVAVQAAESVLRNLRMKKVAVLGLSFKPDTDDMRGAVSVRLIPELQRKGALVTAYDAVAGENAKHFLRGVKVAKSASECIEGADCAIIVTEWEEFRRLRPSFFKKHMRYPFVYDGRRIYDPAEFSAEGVELRAVGLGVRSIATSPLPAGRIP